MVKQGEGGRTGLRADEVIGLAVSIADAEGLPAVAMRRLARELGVTPMALYWHFDDRSALVDAMAERVVIAAEFTDVSGVGWEERYRQVLSSLVALLQRHPWMGRVVIERVVAQPNYLSALEILLDCTRLAGLPSREGVIVVEQAVQTIAVTVEYEPHRPVGAKADALRADVVDFISRVDPDEFPNVHRAAEPLLVPPPVDLYYRIVLDTLVAGLRAAVDDRMAARQNRPERPRSPT